MNSELIPFGKYKGQPIEVISHDKKYLDWLTAQSWFREQYGNLYQIVINNFCEPSETPEHNALQARFLDPAFRLKFAAAAVPRLWWHAQADGEMVRQAAAWIAKHVHQYKEFIYRFRSLAASEPKFESGGRDVEYSIRAGISFSWKSGPASLAGCDGIPLDGTLQIEIKPDIGDDYPAILRQMRRNGSRFLLTRSYHGTGVDRKTFLAFMESQKISVIFEHEVDESEPIASENFDEKKIPGIDRIRKIEIRDLVFSFFHFSPYHSLSTSS